MNIISRVKYLVERGRKIAFVPVFILSIIVLSGFTPRYIESAENSDQLNQPSGSDAFSILFPKDNFLESSAYFESSNSDSIEVRTKTKLRRSKFRPFKNAEEAIIIISDTSATVAGITDSVKIDSMALDSTARLAQFKYKRKDTYTASVKPKHKFPFFVYPSTSKLSRKVELDSTGKFVNVKEFIGKNEYKVGYQIPIEDYIEYQVEERNRENWDALTSKYEMKKEAQFEDLLSEITNIDIPLPSSSIFSIFGPPKISLRVNGSVDIHGAWRNETTEGVTASLLGNTRNEPDFKQQVQINVQGTVGDKLTLSADWNTERDFQYENQLKIKYTGYEDEIIQSIEAGNVSLQASPLVGGSEALFGLKAEIQLGAFKLTALASQKKGETEEVSLTGGAKAQPFEVRAYDYSKNHFFVHEIFYDRDENIYNDYYGNDNPVYHSQYKIKDIEVWKSITGLVDPNERRLNAYIDLEERSSTNRIYGEDLRDINKESVAGQTVIGTRFLMLEEGNQYTINKDIGLITFNVSVQNEEIIAVAIRMEGPGPGDDDDIFYGEFIQDASAAGQNDVLVMKLIKPANLQPTFDVAWNLQLKSRYPIGGKDVNQEEFVLDIKYQDSGQEARSDFNGVKLLEAFGLDRTDESQTGPPDGAFDFQTQRTISPFSGEIIFPVLEPFGKDLPSSLPDSLKYSSVYDTTYTFARNDRAKDKYVIAGEYSAAVTSTFNVGFNVVENSVKVFFNNTELEEGIDYSVDYLLGQVRVRKEEALVPGADLRITYEKNDLFQMASKTMLGLRGIYEFNERTKLGFSYLNLNQQTLSDKVRIGEEPLNNAIMGVDFNADFDLPFITDGLDYIMSTREMSNINLNAEYAYISPEPNTKKSDIIGDDGKSIAYIDDFEGAKRIIPIGDNYTSWTDPSVPNGMDALLGTSDKEVQMNYKSKTYWYTVTPGNVFVQDIWGDRKQVSREDEQIMVLDFVFDPTKKGTYNRYPSISQPRLNWGGMMKRLSSTANNLVDENIEFIEFWVNIVEAPEDGASIYIDLGQISEDVIPDGELNTEDLNFNDQIDPGEDIGLDGWTDSEERANLGSTEDDPMGDNYSYTQGDYRKINGAEGSASSIDRLLPDTEDLNRNSNLDRLNSYFRYKVSLDTLSSPYLEGGGFGGMGWYLFRIPLKEYQEKFGDPSFSIVESIRIWTNDNNSPVHLRLYDLNLVGNQWRKLLVPGVVTEEDEVLTVSTINIEDNPEYYSPAGLKLERDKTKPDEEVYKNEQSLRMIVNELADGDSREIVKYLYRPLDLFNYREMKMFFWGDTTGALNSIGKSDTTSEQSLEYNAELFFRFGSDSLNYYEYRCPISERWNELAIKFSELTSIKQDRDSLTQVIKVPVSGRVGHTYGLRGNPTLTRVTYFSIGVLNPANMGYDGNVSGDLWINELRVLDADNSPGWAYKASAKLKLADFITIDGNIGQTNPYFHKLSERFGNRIDAKNWGVTANVNLLKLIPFNLTGSNLNVTYSRKESMSSPLYLPGTDIAIDEVVKKTLEANADLPADSLKKLESDIRTETETMQLSETFTVSNMKIRIPSNSWYIRDIINGFTFSFNYNKTSSRNPTTLTNNAWRWDASVNYNLNLGVTKYVQLSKLPIIEYVFDIFPDYKNFKIFYVPQTFTAGLSANRKRTYNQSRTIGTDPNIQRDFTTNRNFSFSWRMTEGGLWNTTLNYRVNIKSSLAYLLVENEGAENPVDLIERPESEIWKRIFEQDMFGKDFDYQQNVDIKFNPKLPKWFDLDRSLQFQLGYSVNYAWLNNFQQEDLGRSAKYTSRINASINFKVKQLFAPLFREEPKKKSENNLVRAGGPAPRGNSRRGNPQENNEVSVNVDEMIAKTDSSGILNDSLSVITEEYTEPFYNVALMELKRAVRWIFFDYDQINMTYNHDNSYGAGGLRYESNGFSNFWGYKHHDFNGPSRMFMFGFSQNAGPRAPNATITDNNTQKNTFELKTQRDLWNQAKISINWHLDFGFNKSSRITTDENGDILASEITSTGTLNRTFMSFPSSFVFSVFGTEIKKVHELYDPTSDDPTKNLTKAFIEGFEAFPLISKIPILKDVAKYIPRPNWNLQWSGLEKIGIFDFADKISLNHAYTSNFSEGWKIKADGSEEIQVQRIDYGFSPLIGINFSMKNLLGGDINTNFKYSTRASYNLGVSTRNITEDFSQDISLSLTYTKRGFEIPMFGINFKNDLELSFTYTNGKTSTVIFDMDEWRDEGTPQNGQIRTQMEPRMKFQMSQTVTASIFYRRTSFEPEGAARKPPTTTNEMGLDINIQIR